MFCRYEESCDNIQGANNTNEKTIDSPGTSDRHLHKTKAELTKEISDTDSVNDPSSTDSEPPPSYEDACQSGNGEPSPAKYKYIKEDDHEEEDEEFSERLI